MADFLLAAFPWIVMAIVVALVLANSSRKKGKLNIEKQKGTDEKNSMSTADEDDYMSVGMCLGMCFGCVLSLSGIVLLSYGISFGMLIGMTVGMYIKKK